MHNEMIINIGANSHTAFFQEGFYSPTAKFSPLHKHSYAEIHIVANTTTRFKIGDGEHSAKDGNLILIPRNVFHCVTSREPDIKHTAFQIDCETEAFSTQQISIQTALDFINETKKCKATGNYATVSAYISLFCSKLFSENLQGRPLNDYGFLICEFLSNHYNENLRLEDLANALHLSPRQTERLVIKATGNTFKKELTARRVTVAKHLLKTTDMSLDEISRYVGYQSYTGFWKAMKKHNT